MAGEFLFFNFLLFNIDFKIAYKVMHSLQFL